MRKRHWPTVRANADDSANVTGSTALRSKIILAVLAASISALPVQAHHSFAAEFDGNKPVRLIGTITRIEWTNPHSYFYLDVPDSKGTVSNWACESGNPGALSRRGWKKGDIKFGDKLVVDGYLAKDGSRLIDARRVTLPDGRVVYGGSVGDGGPGDPAQPASQPAPAGPTGGGRRP
jgi:hypothetical protein